MTLEASMEVINALAIQKLTKNMKEFVDFLQSLLSPLSYLMIHETINEASITIINALTNQKLPKSINS